jgi:hypothetical protein
VLSFALPTGVGLAVSETELDFSKSTASRMGLGPSADGPPIWLPTRAGDPSTDSLGYDILICESEIKTLSSSGSSEGRPTVIMDSWLQSIAWLFSKEAFKISSWPPMLAPSS